MLRLLAPVLPFATEEVWSWRHEGSIHQASWPTTAELGLSDNPTQGVFGIASEALIQVRRAKTDRQLSQRHPVTRVVLAAPALLNHAADDLKALGHIESLELTTSDTIELVEFEAPDAE